MGVDFVMRIVEPRADGTLELLECDRSFFDCREYRLRELFGDSVPGISETLKMLLPDQASFPWFRKRFEGYYEAGHRQMSVSDCWLPNGVLESLDSVCRTLQTWDSHFPRFYYVLIPNHPGEWTDRFIYRGDKPFRVFSWWDECYAVLDEPENEKAEEGPWNGFFRVPVQFKVDLRALQELPCRERIVHLGEDGKRTDEMGPETTLKIESISCYEHFRQTLEEMARLCRRAIALDALLATYLA